MSLRSLFFFFALLLVPLVAHADDAAAREHFKKGVDLYDKKSYEPALAEFRAAYAAKPSAGIKQNIGLTLKALGRRAEAAAAFDEALDEGKGTLKPDTQAAIERELADLTKALATVTVKIVVGERTIDGGVLKVDGAPLPPGAQRRPIRLEPGIHTFDAHVDGYGDPPQKKLALVAGSPVDATFELRGGGNVTIRPSLSDAVVSIDGQKVARGTYVASLPPGQHRIEVVAEGYLNAVTDLQVSEGQNVDLPITMRKPADAPEAYEAPDRKPPPPPKKFIGALMAGLNGQTAKVAEPSAGTTPLTVNKHALAGLSLGLKGGYRPSRFFVAELGFEAAGLEDKGNDKDVKLSEWTLLPMARFTSAGRVRFTTAVGIGLHEIKAEVTETGSPSRKGSTITGSFAFDIGGQIEAGPVYFEPVLFFDWHGVGSVRDESSPGHERILEDSPGLRWGLRLALGMPF